MAAGAEKAPPEIGTLDYDIKSAAELKVEDIKPSQYRLICSLIFYTLSSQQLIKWLLN